MKSKILLPAMLMATFTAMGQEKLYENTFNLCDVQLLDGPFKRACDLNVNTLLQYDTDRLLAPFLKAASLEPKGESFENWIGLDGHVGSHYLSALAIHYASTGDEECHRRMIYMIDELDRCQKAIGTGYVGGVELACWDRIARGDIQAVWDYWVPWYNVHKTYSGLRDAWLYGNSEKARDMFLWLCDWGIDLISHLSGDEMEHMLSNEFGGMDEVYADAYQMTDDIKYLEAAKRFSHQWLLGSMAANIDDLDNRHANTQVPKVIGYQRIAEMCEKEGQIADATLYDRAARYFWHTVADTRSLAIGGNSRREHFASAADCLSYVDDREGPESCNTYNMLKLTEGLSRMHGDAFYADFYERAMMNHIYSTQHPEHGGYVYFTSARPGHYRVYSSPNSAMWCCVGTGMENHGKYGQYIYTHKADTLNVNLFVASTLNWKDRGVKVTQLTDFPAAESSKLVMTMEQPTTFTLRLRNPAWTVDGKMGVTVNGETVAHECKKSSWIDVTRTWHDGDIVDLALPMEMTLEELPNCPQYVAIMRGPIVMGTRIESGDLSGLVSDDGRWSHIAHGALMSLFDTPFLIGDRTELISQLNSLVPAPDNTLKFSAQNLFVVPNKDETKQNIVLEPWAQIHDSRYMMYFPTMTAEEFAEYQASARAKEAEKLRLDALTVDAVALAEQQPEVDHSMRQRNTSTGNTYGESWRCAKYEPWHGPNDEAFVEYTLATDNKENLQLMLRALPSGDQRFDILIDDNVIATEEYDGISAVQFGHKSYSIPTSLLRNREYIKVRLRPHRGCSTGRISNLRLTGIE